MKPGSLVHCIDNTTYANNKLIIQPALNTPYFVRSIMAKGERIVTPAAIVLITQDIIYLEEIINKPLAGDFEPPYILKHFREVLPPGELNLEEILELQLK